MDRFYLDESGHLINEYDTNINGVKENITILLKSSPYFLDIFVSNQAIDFVMSVPTGPEPYTKNVTKMVTFMFEINAPEVDDPNVAKIAPYWWYEGFVGV